MTKVIRCYLCRRKVESKQPGHVFVIDPDTLKPHHYHAECFEFAEQVDQDVRHV